MWYWLNLFFHNLLLCVWFYRLQWLLNKFIHNLLLWGSIHLSISSIDPTGCLGVHFCYILYFRGWGSPKSGYPTQSNSQIIKTRAHIYHQKYQIPDTLPVDTVVSVFLQPNEAIPISVDCVEHCRDELTMFLRLLLFLWKTIV